MPSIFNQHTTTQGDHLALGKRGEVLAAEYLESNGYRIVATNFTTPIGHSINGRPITGEIDIIAYDESSSPFTLAFIEVKTRTGTEFAAPQTAVDRRKQRHIIKAARIYRRLMRIEVEASRYDVVTVIMPSMRSAQIQLLPGYFTEHVFANSHWQKRPF